jgi:hypothetical protein
MRRIIITAAVSAAALGGVAAAAVPAMASTSTATLPVIVKTYSPLHPDTTSVSGSATQMLPDGNGPVWSYDNLHETITAKPESAPGNWNVTIKAGNGSNYHGFADPRMASEGSSDPGGILASQGTVTGSIRYDIQSSTPPDPSNVPATEPAGTGLGAVLTQLFDGHNTTVGGGHYLFNYTNVGGTPYSQAG